MIKVMIIFELRLYFNGYNIISFDKKKGIEIKLSPFLSVELLSKLGKIRNILILCIYRILLLNICLELLLFVLYNNGFVSLVKSRIKKHCH